jgi:hypothetical protein
MGALFFPCAPAVNNLAPCRGAGAFFEDLTQPEAAERIAAGAVVLVPVRGGRGGAGPHFPLNTTGDPTLATRATGEAILDEMVRQLVEGLKAAFPEAFVTA